MSKTESITKANRLSAAIAERKALRRWQETGGMPENRPLTPHLDEMNEIHSRPEPKSRPKGAGRKPSEHDERVMDAFVNPPRAISFPSTTGEIAAAAGIPASSTHHVVKRLVAAGKLVIVGDGRTRYFWAPEVGDAPERPQIERTARTRKVHSVKGAGKAVHAAHAHRGENGTEYDVLCSATPANLSKVADDVTCKRCTKLVAEQTAA